MSDETPNTDTPLNKMTVKDLREIAKDIPGVTGISSMKKDQLISLIGDTKDAPKAEKKPATKKSGKTKPGKKLATVKDIKAAIAKLNEEKKQAAQTAGRKETNILRRRINRLKKRSRKIKVAAA